CRGAGCIARKAAVEVRGGGMKLVFMKLLLAMTIPLLAQNVTAQNQLTISGPATARPGDTILISIAITSNEAAGGQWSLDHPAGVVLTPVTESAPASKTLSCSADGATCLVWGMNSSSIAPGTVAQIAAAVTSTGPAVFTLSGVIAGTPDGAAIPVAAGPQLVVNILAPEDLNGDGKIDIQDAQIVVDQATGRTVCGSGDLNKDGKCDLLDLMRLI